VNVIETEGLTHYYSNLCALDKLDLSVKKGELFAYLGPNGAGKTTTIRTLTGLIRPSRGRALIDGLDITERPMEAKARVGVVPQRSNLYGELTAQENLVFVAQLYGLPRAQWRTRADELLAEFDLTDRADALFATLSGGMKRRLTIAAALVHRPSILFLDEPTTGLDVQSARALRQTILRLREQGVTIFLTTHQIAEAERLADRVGIIVKGRLVAVDSPANLCARIQGESRLELTVNGAGDGLADALAGSPHVASVARSGETLHLTVRSLEAALADVVAAVSQLGVSIHAIHSTNPSLEDAFVQLTHLDAEAMRGGGAGNGRGGQAA
jgi:ABC-2 type transport system ATP-binding protein